MLVSRTGARRYLPDLIAQALRRASGAGAGMVLAAQHLTQGSLDGVTAALPAGPVTELDLMWLFAVADDLVTEPATTGAREALLRTLCPTLGVADCRRLFARDMTRISGGWRWP